jgi:cell wall-associated NlpC family hydrolase
LITETQRAAVVSEALTWLQTPYEARQQCKMAGVDCIQFVAAVFRNVGLLPPDFDCGKYSPQWHLHSRQERLFNVVKKYCDETPIAECRSGDLLLYRTHHVYSHAAIIYSWPIIIHAMSRVGVTLDKWDGLAVYRLKVKETKAFVFQGGQ